ncbi:hypothetical protein VPHD481_0013 [Vibrio phage D481]
MSSTDKTDLVYRHLDFADTSKILNLPDATLDGSPLPKSQIEALLAAKQNSLSDENGIVIDGANIAIDLLLSDPSLSLSGTWNYYSRNSTGSAGDFDVAGYVDMGVGEIASFGSSSPYNFQVTSTSSNSYHWYRRDNGDGTYMVLGFYLPGGQYTIAKVTGDPADFTNVVVEYKASPPTTGHKEIDGERYADSDHAGITLAAGGNISYAKFQSGQLAVNVAHSEGEATTGKVFDAKVAKDLINEKTDEAKIAANTTFDNTSASYPQAPTDVQSMGEAAKEQIDIAKSTADGAVTVNTTQNTNIAAHSTVLGVSNGATHLGGFTNDLLDDNADVKTVFESIATEMDSRAASTQALLGVTLGDTGMGDMTSTIYTDDTDVKSLLDEAGSAIESLQVGAGAFWTAVDYHHHEDSHALPAGFGDGSTDVGTLVIDPTGSNILLSAMNTGDRILVIGDGTDPVTGIYVVNADNSTQRATDAQASGDFTTNKTVNIINGGSHAGATYAYVGASDPTLGSDPLPFEFKQGTNVGDTTITEAKLSIVLAQKVNDKTDKETATFDINTSDGNGGFTETIAHTLGEDYIAQVADAATGEVRTNFEVVKSDNQVVVNSNISVTGLKIVIIG